MLIILTVYYRREGGTSQKPNRGTGSGRTREGSEESIKKGPRTGLIRERFESNPYSAKKMEKKEKRGPKTDLL